jgi:hypothetical protein
VNTRRKLLASIVANPGSVRFDEACKVAEWPGFTYKGGKGSHRAFARAGEPDLLVFQDRSGFVPPYQGRQLAKMIEKYGDEDA